MFDGFLTTNDDGGISEKRGDNESDERADHPGSRTGESERISQRANIR